MAIKLKWSTLLRLTELEFEPEPPKVLSVSDELIQAISWLTACTRHDRRLLRCTENGALLIADAWSLMSSVQTDELHPVSASPDTFTATTPNQGVLIATSTQIIKVTVTRVSGGGSEVIYIPPGWSYWYPHKVYTIVSAVVPDPGGTASYVGITAYN